MKIDQLSVFFPAYNEEKNIENTVLQADKVLQDLKLKAYEIIVVDDGSCDKTPQILKKLQLENKKLKVITHNPNKGYGEALKSGFYCAQYPWIAVTDSDGQFDFSDVTLLLSKTDQAQVVWGYRVNRQDSLIRKINGWGWTFLVNFLLGIKVKDVDCAFKLIKKEVIDTIPHLESTRGGMISPEILAKAKKAGFKITEVGVSHYPRKGGEQTGANVKVIFTSFVNLFNLWWKIR